MSPRYFQWIPELVTHRVQSFFKVKKKKKFKYQKFLSDYESYLIFLIPVFNQISWSLPKSYLLPLKLTGNKLINVKCLEQNSACSKNSINVSNKYLFVIIIHRLCLNWVSAWKVWVSKDWRSYMKSISSCLIHRWN